MLPTTDTDGGKVTIDRQVTAVLHDDHGSATITKDGCDLPVEDGPYLCPGLSLDVNAFLVEGDMALDVCDGVGAKAVYNLVASDNRHGQTSTVTLERGTQTEILGRVGVCVHAFLFGCEFSFTGIGLLSSLTFCCLPGFLCLAGSTFCTGFLLCTALGSSTGFFLGFLFPGLCLRDTTGMLTGCSLCSSFLTGQFLCTLLGGLGLCLPFGFCLSTGLGSGYLLGNEFVDTGIEFGIALLLLGDDALNGLLFFLQTGNHLLLFHLFCLE